MDGSLEWAKPLSGNAPVYWHLWEQVWAPIGAIGWETSPKISGALLCCHVCYVLLSFSAELGQTTANGGKGALLPWPYELLDQINWWGLTCWKLPQWSRTRIKSSTIAHKSSKDPKRNSRGDQFTQFQIGSFSLLISRCHLSGIRDPFQYVPMIQKLNIQLEANHPHRIKHPTGSSNTGSFSISSTGRINSLSMKDIIPGRSASHGASDWPSDAILEKGQTGPQLAQAAVLWLCFNML